MEDQDEETEMDHLKSVLRNNNYKLWMFKTTQKATQKPKGMAKKGGFSYSVPLPYVQAVSEQLARVFRKQGLGTYHKPFNAIRQQLVHPKDPTAKEKKCGAIYKAQCTDCEEDYIGETARPFVVTLKEHDNITRASTTAVGDHLRDTGHTLDFSTSLIIARENSRDELERPSKFTVRPQQ